MAPQISVVIAIHHPVVTLGVRSVLRQCPDIEIVAECSSLPALARALRRHAPRVVIVGTGVCDGEQGALEAVSKVSAETRVALFCTHSGDVPEHAFLQGASAVLPSDIGLDEFVEAVRAVAAGRRWRVRHKASRTAGKKHKRRHQSENSVLAALSARERQIAQGVVVGKRNREIAEAFGISPGTVKLHLNHIYGKLGVTGRLALLRKVVVEVAEID